MIKNKLQIIMTIGWIFLISIFMAIAVYALTTTKELKFFAGIKYDPTIIVDVYINDNLVFSSRAPGEVNQDYIDNIVNDTINFNSNIIAGETYNIRIVNCDTQKDILYTINNNGELSGVIEKNNGTNSNEATEVITITETGLGQTLFSIKLEILYDLKDLDGNDDETGLSFGELGTIKNITGKTFYVSDIDGLLKLSALVGQVNTTTTEYGSDYGYGYNNSAGPAVTFSGATIQMLNDIDCENGDNKDNFSKKFIPIGNETNSFQGTFDGNNKTITGLYINQTTSNVGLFGYVSNAEIKDLTMQNCKVVGGDYNIGNVVGYANNSSISNCSAEETYVSGDNEFVGGIVGDVHSGTTITNCYNTGSVSGSSGSVGGIGGGFYGPVTIANCFNTGSVSTRPFSVGGIAGTVRGGTATITNCYNTGSVSADDQSYVGGIVGDIGMIPIEPVTAIIANCYNTGSVSGDFVVGGILGDVFEGTVTIVNCYNTDSVGGRASVGGIVGEVRATVTITNCYNTGSLSDIDYYGSFSIGGIAGTVRSGTATIANCYNTGSFIIGFSSDVGGIVGDIREQGTAIITNCYYLKTSSVNSSLNAFWGNDGTLSPSSYFGTFSSAESGVTKCSDSPSELAYGTSNLRTVLNAYVTDETSGLEIELTTWEIRAGENDGYPVFA